ncbi:MULTISPECIES: DUF2507 domain-containing protein [Gracilibacillus]|uniref:DUF2507 domain-containing protein n=1 Tax=Gracilibacillus TaxID=74385 RepID=UPI000824D2CA|nr:MULTISPECIES: DUF2507 domain-containing protein [Gracilibacillus]
MTKQNTSIATILANLQTTSSGYDLIRYIGLPDMLGQEKDLILYIMGKNLARKAQCGSKEEIQEFFVDAGWGDLHLLQEKRRGFIYELSGEIIEARQQTLGQIDYVLEAGFLAEAMVQIMDESYECIVEEKKQQILLNVLHN